MKPLRRALIVQPYGIGDLLFITPVIRALKEQAGFEIVDLVLGSRTNEVIRSNPFIDKIFIVDKDLFRAQKSWSTIKDILSLVSNLRKRKYDLLLDYSFRDEYGFLAQFILGISKRAGYSRKRRGMFHNIKVSIPNGFEGKHVTEYACQMLEQCGIEVKNKGMDFYLNQEDSDQVRLMIHSYDKDASDYIVVSPGGGESWGRDAFFKRWPVEYFAELISELCKKIQVKLVFIVGSPTETNLCEELKAILKADCFNLAGRLSISQTAALINQSRCFIGNDGGLVHVAHALKVPLIAFYGPADPVVYGPYPRHARTQIFFHSELSCRPCYVNFRYNAACVGRECLQELFPKNILPRLNYEIFEKSKEIGKQKQ
jgi:lipopolysaccharide heptosyltransferase II